MIRMNFSFKNSLLGGALLLLLVLQSTVAKADDDKSKSKPKKETKYDRLFKDKRLRRHVVSLLLFISLITRFTLSCHVLC